MNKSRLRRVCTGNVRGKGRFGLDTYRVGMYPLYRYSVGFTWAVLMSDTMNLRA